MADYPRLQEEVHKVTYRWLPTKDPDTRECPAISHDYRTKNLFSILRQIHIDVIAVSIVSQTVKEKRAGSNLLKATNFIMVNQGNSSLIHTEAILFFCDSTITTNSILHSLGCWLFCGTVRTFSYSANPL